MKNIVTVLLFVTSFQLSFAQLVVSPDTAICAGRYTVISASGGGSSYSWSPSAGLNSPNSSSTVAAPTTTTTYVVTSLTPLSNQFVNGDFSQGNTGFTSGYTYINPPNNQGNAYYWVGGTPTLFSGGMVNCADHTSGVDTNQLIADGATVANTPVWCQTIAVLPNVTYTLSGYMHPLNNTNMPGGQWSVNGTVLNGSSPTPLFPCQWTNFTATWNSGVNTSATFCVQSNRLQANGNDFAIDDLTITANAVLTDSVTITVNTPPTVNLGADTLLCNLQPLVLDAGNTGATFAWSDNSTTQTVSGAAGGTFSVTVTDANLCTATDAVVVTTYTLDASVNTANTTCGNNNGIAAAVVTNGYSPYTYEWDNNGTGDTIHNLGAGTYVVTVTDGVNCSATASGTINSSSGGSITITAATSQICATDSAQICAPAGYQSYLWNTGQSTQCIYGHLAGNYYVTVTDNTNCSSTSNAVSLNVYTQPSVSVSVNGDTLQAFNANSYQWFFNGNPIPNATSDTYVATQAGNYSVQITDANGCYAMSNGIPVATGMDNTDADQWLDVFPNPNHLGIWQVSVNAGWVGKKMEIFDVQGKLILQSVIREPKSEIKFESAAGVYLLKIVAGEKTYWKKLIRQ